jgi:hypothetical protein
MKDEDFILIFLYAMAGAFVGACLFSILDHITGPGPEGKLQVRVHYPPGSGPLPEYQRREVPVPPIEPDRPA